MKKILILAATAALLVPVFSSCEKHEPTEISATSMPDKAVLYGYVRSRTISSESTSIVVKYTDYVLEPKCDVVVEVTTIGSTNTSEIYRVKTDQQGMFKLELSAPVGKTVKGVAYVQLKDRPSYIKVGSAWIQGIANLYGSTPFSVTSLKSSKITIDVDPDNAYSAWNADIKN